MSFRDRKELSKDRMVNKAEREGARHLPERGSFKEVEAGAGNKTWKMDRRGIWLGSQLMEEAPFSVSMEGLFKLLSNIGDGSIGMSAEEGLWIGADTFADAPFSVNMDGVFKIKASGTGDKFVGIDAQQGIWLGSDTFATAPFSVDMDGNIKIKASSATEDTAITFYDADDNLSIYLGFEDIT